MSVKKGETKATPGLAIPRLLPFSGAMQINWRLRNCPRQAEVSAEPLARETVDTLRQLAVDLEDNAVPPRLEDLERRLTVMEEKLFAVLLAATPDEQIVAVRAPGRP